MNKKTVIYLIIIAVVILICFTPFNQKKTVNIQAPYFITLQQLLRPDNWKNWQPDTKLAWKQDSSQVKLVKRRTSFTIQKPGFTLAVDHANGFGFDVKKTINGKTSNYYFVAIPSNISGNSIIICTKKINLIQLMGSYFGADFSLTDIPYLKNYLEDPRQYYGFDIKKTTVTDSNVVVIKKVVATTNKLAAIAQIQQDLKQFIQQHHLKIVQPLIADIRDIGTDSLRIMIGLPIDKQTLSAGKIEFMHLPPHGRMLTGLYTGKYSGRQKLYLAMKTYIADHSLSSPEDPYEKYLDNKIPASDTSLVHLQVNFPIY